MKLKHKDLEIVQDNPFLNCKLQREPFASILTEILEVYSDNFVLAINNEWGTGKTTFIKMWEQQLKNKGFKTLYFNAWENDFENDILVALISELVALKNEKTEMTFDGVLKKATPLIKSMSMGIIKTQLEKFTGEDFVEQIFNINESALSKNLADQIQLFKNRKACITEFKSNLEKFVSQSMGNKPIVFIIDELDRCRPNYAVEFLEQIKQLFSVKGIVFILSIDKVQLCHAIRGVYGNLNINAEEYIKRFIDIEYSIPEPNSQLFCNYLYDYFQFSEFFNSKKRRGYNDLADDGTAFLQFSNLIFNHNHLSLRTQEKIFAHARLSLCTFNSNQYVLPYLFTLLIYLKINHKDIYDGIKNDLFSIQELIDKVEDVFPQNLTDTEIRILLYTECILLITYHNGNKKHLNEKLLIESEDPSKSYLNVKSKIDKTEKNEKLKDMFQAVKNGRIYSHDVSIKHLITKIDLTDGLKLN